MRGFPMQTGIDLYQGKFQKGQYFTGAGQASTVNGGVYTLAGETDQDLFGKIAICNGSFGEYCQFNSGSLNRNRLAGIFVDDKLHQNPAKKYGDEPTFDDGDRVTVMTQGRCVVQTIGTLAWNQTIYVYVGTADPQNVGKLTNTAGLAGETVELGGGDVSYTSPIAMVKAEDGLALIQINVAG